MRKKLTPKQQAFVNEYLKDLNAIQAALRAGYAPSSAGAYACKMMKRPDITAAIQKAMDKRGKKVELDADFVLKELGDVYKDLRVIAQEPGDFNPVLKALELIGRHNAMFTDNVRHAGRVELLSDEELDERIAAISEEIGIPYADSRTPTTH